MKRNTKARDIYRRLKLWWRQCTIHYSQNPLWKWFEVKWWCTFHHMVYILPLRHDVTIAPFPCPGSWKKPLTCWTRCQVRHRSLAITRRAYKRCTAARLEEVGDFNLAVPWLATAGRDIFLPWVRRCPSSQRRHWQFDGGRDMKTVSFKERENGKQSLQSPFREDTNLEKGRVQQAKCL